MARAKMQIVRPDKRTVVEWAEHIGEIWKRLAEDLIEAGRRLLAARSDLDEDGYAEVLAHLRMRPETAHKLIRISESDRLAHCDKKLLPSSMDTLLNLTMMSDSEWELAEQSNLINTELTQAQLRKFRKAAKKQAEQEDVERVATAGADPTVPLDENAREAFKREAALHGAIDRMEHYLEEAEPDLLARELKPGIRKMVLGKLAAIIADLQEMVGVLGGAGG